MAGGAGNSPRRVLFASLIGTTIEYFDFYIYATAAVLVFPQLFFPPDDPGSARLQSLATFALAFFARPLGSALFGHFGDRVGRKATLVAALLTMGLSTVFIGLLPTYQSIGLAAPLLLALCRLGQGLGLGGEWGGAVLLATENAPPGKQAWYGMFPQLGAPLGFLCSTGVFLLLSEYLSDAEFFAWGWRVPFIASALLVFVGLYVRLRLHETPAFQRAIDNNERVRLPMLTVCTQPCGDAGVGNVRRHRHLRGVLSDDGVLAELGHFRAGLFAPGVPDPADDRRAVLRPHYSDFGGDRRPARPARDADRRHAGHNGVRPVLRAAVWCSLAAACGHIPRPGAGPDGAHLRSAWGRHFQSCFPPRSGTLAPL